jgi:hypothetical protein
MRFEERSFPYPVLSPGRDDVQPNSFNATLTVTPETDAYQLDFAFELMNPTLIALVKDGAATLTVHVECASNFFRRMFPFNVPNGRVTIPANELLGAVEVSFFVTAAEAIPDYRIDGAHADYGSATFTIRAGDVLAIAPGATFDADKDFDPLKKISSIVQICPADEIEEGPFSLDFATQKLSIFLAKNDYQRYSQLLAHPGIAAVLVQGIVVAALVEAIAYMRQTPAYEAAADTQPRWFRVIRQRLIELNESYSNQARPCVELAQKLLSNPLARCLRELMPLTEATTPKGDRE